MQEQNQKLSQLIKAEKSIAVIGMCKNAGKTTVLNFLISSLTDCVLGISSIGRDGETVDVVTGTNKPRIFIPASAIAATAEKLLKNCTASREILYKGGYNTPLGEIVVFRAMTSGYVDLAGPSIISEGAKIKDIMVREGAHKILIDGALDRRSLSSGRLADAVILSSGASYDGNIRKTVAETATAAAILSAKQSEYAHRIQHTDRIYAFDRYGAILRGEADFGDESEGFNGRLVTELKRQGAVSFYFPGAVTSLAARTLYKDANKNIDKEIIAKDPSNLFLSSLDLEWLKEARINIAVLRPVKLIAVTANPFAASGRHYDAAQFLGMLRGALSVPVFDVKSGGENNGF